MRFFGYELVRSEPEIDKRERTPTFVPKQSDDGAMNVAAGGAFGTYVDLDGTVRSEAELITRYRDMSLHPECDKAIDEIVNEALSFDSEHIVSIDLDDIECSEDVKESVREEFEKCLRLLDFKDKAYELFRRWYIDGQLYFHPIIDESNPRAGILEMRYIDPRKIRKIREIVKKRVPNDQASDVSITKTKNEYFIYNDKGFSGSRAVSQGSGSTVGLKIAKDTIVHVVSGLTDNNGSMVLSFLHKAIKSLTQLRTLEDALVIYRLARAPERRVWYIDVGNMSKIKAEQYLQEIITKHKNKLVYDASTGEIRDDRKFMTLLEDYWLPRKEGGRGTEVTTLKGGETLGQMDDVLYFQKMFLMSLNVPVGRLNTNEVFSIGRATEITRDELAFSRFVSRLRKRFSSLFNRMLEKQLALRGVMTVEDWTKIADKVRYDYAVDTYFEELKDSEIMTNRATLAQLMEPYTGKYFSCDYVRKEVFKQSDDDVERMDKEIGEEKESGDPRWISQQEMMMQQQDPSQAGMGPESTGEPGAPPPSAGPPPSQPANKPAGGAKKPAAPKKIQDIAKSRMAAGGGR